MPGVAEGYPFTSLSGLGPRRRLVWPVHLAVADCETHQVRNNSFCHWLGVEGSHTWDYIGRPFVPKPCKSIPLLPLCVLVLPLTVHANPEPGSPFVGVQLTYYDGEYCQEGVNRQVK